ncbi:expressed unknown protein [Seminavis robusta]|uniref:Methyltransferase FkbM domain-containing protein n=1 Tax=Seminavis robusta TaxID=568900 RepID=A0A9N8HPI0_9STRA|nr:expressed unknown protein [Seminavis robusta]|eukprot:Sro903_g218320.1 n/a (281) ;mRNA; f:34966-35808
MVRTLRRPRQEKQQQPSAPLWSENAARLTRIFGSMVVTVLTCTGLSFSHRSLQSSLETIESALPVQKEQTPQAEQTQEPAAIGYNRTKYHYTPPSQSFGGPHSSCGVTDSNNNNPPTYESFFALEKDDRSRDNEDKIIWKKFFASMGKRGNYIEMGAFNGAQESNSRFFDVCLGWKGLLVEANPMVFPEVPVNRPQAHSMSFAPSCPTPDQTLEFHATIWTNAGLEGKAKAYDGTETVSVPCGPLQPVLEDVFAGEAIDFFSLDVEGAERWFWKPLILTR